MSLYNLFAEKLVLPLSDKVLDYNVYGHLKFLQDSQWWSHDDLVEYQNERLKIMIKYAYDKVPYYRDVMKEHKLTPNDIKSRNDLKKMPILTKDDIISNFPDKIVSPTIPLKNCVYLSGSGSTGQTVRYYLPTDAYSFNLACHLRGWYWMGYRIGDKMIKISQNKRFSKQKRYQDLINRTYLFTHKYTSDNMNYFVDLLHKTNAQFLRSYPDPLLFIATHLKKNNIELPQIKAINTTGNILFEPVRELAEKTFKTKIFDCYSTEGGPNVFECPTHQNYHISMEYSIAEILDKDGNEVGEGEMGRKIVTSLWNFSTPFIRFDSKDIVQKGQQCSCGRGLDTIKKIEGRDNDILVTPDGNYLIAQSFTVYFKLIKAIDQFQVYQPKNDEMVFKLVVNDKFDSKLENEIINHWRKYTNNTMKISIDLVEQIGLLKSGKRRFLIRNQNINLGL